MLPCPVIVRAHPRLWSAVACHRFSSCPYFLECGSPAPAFSISSPAASPHSTHSHFETHPPLHVFLCFQTLTTVKFHNPFLLIFMRIGGGYTPLPTLDLSRITRNCTQALFFHTLPNSFAPRKNVSLLFSSDSELFAQKHPGWGGGHIPQVKKLLSSSSSSTFQPSNLPTCKRL